MAEEYVKEDAILNCSLGTSDFFMRAQKDRAIHLFGTSNKLVTNRSDIEFEQ